jgi:hypothetical protein
MATKAEKISALKRAIRKLSGRSSAFTREDFRILEEVIEDLGGNSRNIPGRREDNDSEDDNYPIG